MVERAFEPFYTTKPKGEGTGLGLATVYGIVTQTGGTVEIAVGAGRGHDDRGAAAGHRRRGAGLAASDNGADGATHGETILVVEDEEAVRRLTCRILTREGYSVLEAPDGPHAIDTWDEHPGEIDLLLTDVVMPGMSGKELADTARHRARVHVRLHRRRDLAPRHGRRAPGAEAVRRPDSPGRDPQRAGRLAAGAGSALEDGPVRDLRRAVDVDAALTFTSRPKLTSPVHLEALGLHQRGRAAREAGLEVAAAA